MSTLADLYALQEELLQAAVAALDTIPDDEPDLEGAPELQYVGPPGDLAIDCAQVVVNLGPLTTMATAPGAPAGAAAKGHAYGRRISMPTIQLLVARCCLPVGTVQNKRFIPPPPDDQELGVRQLTADGWAIWNGIWNRLHSGDLLDRCTQVEWGGMAPVGPSGACGGWILTLRVRLAGYSQAIGS